MFTTDFSESIAIAVHWMGMLIHGNTREIIRAFNIRAQQAEGFGGKRAWLRAKKTFEWDLNLVAGGQQIRAIQASDRQSTGNPFQPTQRSVAFTLGNGKVVTLHMVECNREFDDHGEVDFRPLRFWVVRAVEWKSDKDAVRTLELF